jgi:hypothetical protein
MSGTTRKLLWLGLALAVGLGLLWQFFPLPDAQDRVAALPKSGIGYTSQDLPLSPETRQVVGQARVLRRAYQLDGQQVTVWVVDGSRNRHAVHDPLYCVRGGGWQILSQRVFPIAGGEARLIRALRDGHETESLVWFSDGRTRHASAPRYWWQTTFRRLTLGGSGPEPVLVIVQPLDARAVNWRRLLQDLPFLDGL